MVVFLINCGMKLNAQNASIRLPARRRASRPAEQRVQNLLSRMTLAEMAAQQARKLVNVPGDFEPGHL